MVAVGEEKVMSKFLALLLLIPVLSLSKGKKPMSNLISPKITAESILSKAKNSGYFELGEILAYQENPQVYSALVQKLKLSDKETKVACLSAFSDLGSTVEASPEGEGFGSVPFIGNSTLIGFLVESLGDKDREVRNEASRQVLKWVPDLYLRNHSKEVVDHISANPSIDDPAELLAKTGSERARALIRSNTGIRNYSGFSTRISLAKLGDSVQENETIEAYKKEQDMREKKILAHALGFIASPKSILTLAQDLRTPLTYPWNQRAPRSFRVHVIEGLGKAYPMEPLFWRPQITPTKDTYYQAIEEWATKNLGVTWSTPRPPFLYQIEVPMAAPPRR
jgi:hypothetical protein